MLKQQFAIASLSILVFLISSCLVAGQVFRAGSCPCIKPMQNLNVDAFLGDWWWYAKYPDIFNIPSYCEQAEYTVTNQQLYVTTKALDPSSQPITKSYAVTLLPTGQLQVRLGDNGGVVDYSILGTDYNNYAVLYVCQNLIFSYAEYLWIYTRVPNPTEDVINEAIAVVEANKLAVDEFKLGNLTNCQY